MKKIEQKIIADIKFANGANVLDCVEHCDAKNVELDGYVYETGDVYVSDDHGSCVYRPSNGDWVAVWKGGAWA